MSAKIGVTRDGKAARVMLAVFLCFFLIILVPLALVDVPPLVDYPNHLARMYILLHAEDSPGLQRYYAPHWTALPNLAMEGIVPLLGRFMPLETAGKAFVALTLLALSSGTVALHYALWKRISPWPLVIFLLLYNRILLWGFLGYLFGVGLALWAVAAWIMLRERNMWLRTAVFTLASLVLFFAHLYALGLYALCVVMYEAARFDFRAPPRDWLRHKEIFVPLGISLFVPCVVLLGLSPTAEGAGAVNYGRAFRKVAALAGLFNTYDRNLDLSTVAVLATLGALALFRRKLVLAKTMLPTLLVMAAVFLAMPEMLFTSQAADIRFSVGFAAVAIAATDLRPLARPWAPIVAAILIAVLVGRVGYVSGYWRASQGEYRELLSAFSLMPEGSRLYTADVQSVEWKPFPTPTAHFSCMAIIERRAFVPTLFAHPTQQPVEFVGEYRQLAKQAKNAVVKTGQRLPWEQIAAQYDYVMVIHEKGRMDVPENMFSPVRLRRNFSLYRVTPLQEVDYRRAERMSPRR